MKWALIAIVAGQPVPTGITYETYKRCIGDAALFASLMPGAAINDGRKMNRLQLTEYACIAAKG